MKNDYNRLPAALEKTEFNIGGKLELIVGDRGFSEAKTELFIEKITLMPPITYSPNPSNSIIRKKRNQGLSNRLENRKNAERKPKRA